MTVLERTQFATVNAATAHFRWNYKWTWLYFSLILCCINRLYRGESICVLYEKEVGETNREREWKGIVSFSCYRKAISMEHFSAHAHWFENNSYIVCCCYYGAPLHGAVVLILHHHIFLSFFLYSLALFFVMLTFSCSGLCFQ